MTRWLEVCKINDLQPDSGVCALVADRQIALFYFQQQQEIYAVANFDPLGKANVLYRGIIGDIGGEPMVASPLYKQHYSLKTGVCLDEPDIKIPTYPVRLEYGAVLIAISQ